MDISTSENIVPTSHDPDEQTTFYAPLPDGETLPPTIPRRPFNVFAVTLTSVVFLLLFVTVIIQQLPPPMTTHHQDDAAAAKVKFVPPLQPRGVAEGVSAKSNPGLTALSFNWTNAMLSWQRTAYHFQPAKNWMNDPDGPLYHMGYYHLFYQYNPDSAVWGNITWGHAVSTDLIHWLYLPLAMVPDKWYDINGVWTGSATILPSGNIIMIYTGDTNTTVQVQNVAVPKDLSDPLLLHWVKYSGNPVMVPPTGIGYQDFRDPTTAWFVELDQKWRVAIGSKINTTGLAFVYKTEDFYSYEKMDGVLHEVPGTGMWECVDFYPLATNGSVGLDTSAYGSGVKHVLKASLDDTRVDHYAIGTYDPMNDTWRPNNPKEDVGIGLRVDYGRYYASKTFFDPVQRRRILWGWINETDTAEDDLEKGWASVQTIPRKVLFDTKTKSNILEWPVEEVESLRLNSTVFEDVLLEPGSVVPLDVGTATQLDIIAEFETEAVETNATVGVRDCGNGSRDRSTFGPFGLLVIANDGLTELTPFYFRPINASDGTQTTYFCADETRSSLATTVYHAVYGGKVPVLSDENFTMRLLVDHSIVEGFSQGGRTVITSRIYPTEAIYGAARVFLFNNATGVNVKARLKVWHLTSAFIRPFPFDDRHMSTI